MSAYGRQMSRAVLTISVSLHRSTARVAFGADHHTDDRAVDWQGGAVRSHQGQECREHSGDRHSAPPSGIFGNARRTGNHFGIGTILPVTSDGLDGMNVDGPRDSPRKRLDRGVKKCR